MTKYAMLLISAMNVLFFVLLLCETRDESIKSGVRALLTIFSIANVIMFGVLVSLWP